MKTLFLKLASFAIVVIALMTFILERYGGYVDYFYVKMTSPMQTSMILGDSRAMQGIQPEVVNKCLRDGGFEFPMYNFAFTGIQGLYGESYMESVTKKLNPDTKNGLFLIAVSPAQLSSGADDDEKNNKWSEASQPPHNMIFPNMRPNFEYLLRNYEFFHFKAIFRKKSMTHDDGWLQQDKFFNAKERAFKKQQKLAAEPGTFIELQHSAYRLRSLDKLVRFLSKKGKVFLIRMPMDKGLSDIENNYWKDFDDQMSKIAKVNHCKYFNFTQHNTFDMYDGAHLGNESSAEFTKVLCDSIANASNNVLKTN